jgi:hypothetical protein
MLMKYTFVYTPQVAAGKDDDRHVAQPADLEKLAGLLLDAPSAPLGTASSTITALSTAVKVRLVSSLKSQWAEILVARRVQEVEGEPLVPEAHHRRGDRDAARATAIKSERTRRLAPRRTAAIFSVKVVLPASGCEMIANVRWRAIWSLRVLINRLWLLPRYRPSLAIAPAARNGAFGFIAGKRTFF